MTNHRLTFAAGLAVLAAALSLFSLLIGSNWLSASIGAVATVALAGTLTRMATVQAAIAACVAVLIAIVPILTGYGPAGYVAAAAVLGLTAASLTSARIPRVFAAICTYIAAPLLYLNAIFAASASWAGIIPTSRSLAILAGLPQRASAEFRYSPPIPSLRPVEFIVAGGVTLIAIIVDVLAVRLRRPALAGLPLLLLFSVPVASSLKSFGVLQSLAFGLGIAAYLSLLSADGRQRLRMWGRLVSIRRTHAADETSDGPDTRQIAASGRRVGLTAVALAMVAPVFLVGTSPKDLFAKTRVGGGRGELTIPGGLAPLTVVGQDLAEHNPALELTYTTSFPNPQQQYLQAYVLNYDYAADGRWLPDASGGQTFHSQLLPYHVPGLGPGTTIPVSTVSTTIDMAGDANGTLPLPYAPVQIDYSGADLTETADSLMVFATQAGGNPHFTVTSHEPEPTVAELNGRPPYPPSIARSYAGYRGPDAALLLKIARQHTVGAITELQKAVALQTWFNSPAFSYTLRERWPDSGPWLRQFLTRDKRGDCEQFAPAFAVLARLLGIPARVAVGFTGGTKTGHGRWQVTSADAHAWPELYFPQAGWIRFEPTPSGIGDQGTASTPSYTKGVPAPLTVPNAHPKPNASGPSSGPSGKASPGISGKLKQQLAGEGPNALKAGGPGLPTWVLIGAVLFLLLAWPGLVRWLTTRRRWITATGDAGRAQTAWREFLDYLSDYGIAWLPSESPRAIATRIADAASLGPDASAAMTRIGAAEERSRYALASVPGAGLRGDVATVRRALSAQATRPERLRARLLPASTLAIVLRGLQSANHALSWIESPLPSMRRSHRRSAPHRAS